MNPQEIKETTNLTTAAPNAQQSVGGTSSIYTKSKTPTDDQAGNVWSRAERRDQAHLRCGAGGARDGAAGLLPLVLVRRLGGRGLGSLPRHLVGGRWNLTRPRAPERSESRADLTADSAKCFGGLGNLASH